MSNDIRIERLASESRTYIDEVVYPCLKEYQKRIVNEGYFCQLDDYRTTQAWGMSLSFAPDIGLDIPVDDRVSELAVSVGKSGKLAVFYSVANPFGTEEDSEMALMLNRDWHPAEFTMALLEDAVLTLIHEALQSARSWLLPPDVTSRPPESIE